MIALLPLLAQLTVTSQPPLLQLGSDERAVIEVRGEPGARVQVRVSAGTIGAPAEAQPGVYVAEFRPPEDTIPRVLIVAADAEKDGSVRTGWTAVPLWGAADAVIRGKPRSWLTVNIGPNQFGPVRADEAGKAVVHVTVPPGIDDARSGTRTVPLHVPPTPTVLLALDADRLPGGSEHQVAVTLYATSPSGQPLADAKFALTPTAGTISEPIAAEAGVFAAVWTLPADAAGTPRLSASVADRPAVSTAAEIVLDPPPPLEVRLPEPPRLPPPAPRAPSDLSLAISPKLGFVSNAHDFTSPLIGLETALRTDRFGPRLELLGELSWAFSAISATEVVSPGTSVGVRSRADYITAAAALGAVFPVAQGTSIFAHAGPTLARVSSTIKVTGQPAAFSAAIVHGAEISVGVERRMWGSTPFLEARWSISSDPRLAPVLSGSLKWFGIHAGARLDLL